MTTEDERVEYRKKFEIVGNDISDGFHTFTELYLHRCILFVNFAKFCPFESCYKHDDNTSGWFILYVETTEGQVSYHLPVSLLPVVQQFAKEDPNHEWDGHTSEDVLKRLKLLPDCYWPISSLEKAEEQGIRKCIEKLRSEPLSHTRDGPSFSCMSEVANWLEKELLEGK